MYAQISSMQIFINVELFNLAECKSTINMESKCCRRVILFHGKWIKRISSQARFCYSHQYLFVPVLCEKNFIFAFHPFLLISSDLNAKLSRIPISLSEIMHEYFCILLIHLLRVFHLNENKKKTCWSCNNEKCFCELHHNIHRIENSLYAQQWCESSENLINSTSLPPREQWTSSSVNFFLLLPSFLS